jgi:hypothetical protein
MTEVEARTEVSGVHKRFGSTIALDGMTFTVPPGQVTGFVGLEQAAHRPGGGLGVLAAAALLAGWLLLQARDA